MMSRLRGLLTKRLRAEALQPGGRLVQSRQESLPQSLIVDDQHRASPSGTSATTGVKEK
jgi:hypothetical protein